MLLEYALEGKFKSYLWDAVLTKKKIHNVAEIASAVCECEID